MGWPSQPDELAQLNLPWIVGQPVCSWIEFNVYYGSADGLAPGVTTNWPGPMCSQAKLNSMTRYDVNWARPDLGTLIFTNSPFLCHTLHFFPICPVIISSLGKCMAWPSCHQSSSFLSFTNSHFSLPGQLAGITHQHWVPQPYKQAIVGGACWWANERK